MRSFGILSFFAAATSLVAPVLGQSCSTTGVTGTAAAGDPYWLQSIKHQGIAAFNADPSGYQVFRNVKDFGAVGDGVTDDTAAINNAISSGTRCGEGCDSTTTQPAVVYFPSGYAACSWLNSFTFNSAYYYTVLIGDARNPPKLLADASFSGFAVIDADPYIPGGGGAQWYVNQNNFFRSIRNFVIDLTQTPATATTTGIHWQVSQATSIVNVVFEMSTDPNTGHQGIWMENGSGGFLGDVVFNGGKYGMWVGNQQFTVRNVTVNNANTAIFSIWNWGWTFQGVTVNNCQVAFDLTTGGLTQDSQTVGSIAVIDGFVSNTPILVRSSTASNGKLAGALVLNNIHLTNVPTAVTVAGGATVLAGSSGTQVIDSWGQGNVYTGSSTTGTFTQDKIAAPNKPSSLLDSAGRIFGKAHPQYEDFAVSQVVSVRDQGAKGDGKTDDTAALQAVFDQHAGCSLIFVDAGTYLITDTLKIPAGAQVVGEAWSVFLGSGSAFSDQSNPKVVVQVGQPGDTGIVEISDIIFATQAPAAGAIVVEWNIHSDVQGGAGLWDSHIRLGGAEGTNLLVSNCANGTVNDACSAAYLALHLTEGSTAYLEGTWVWLADHDLDSGGSKQITAFSGRGILSESAGPVWLIGTGSEHHTLYQYNLVGAKDHYLGLIQTETPYYQPVPAPPAPFSTNSALHDPTYSGSQTSAWAVNIESSSDIIIFGAGLYSFYQNYDQACLNTTSCQSQIFNIDSGSTVSVYSLATVGVTTSLSIEGSPIIPASANVNGFQSTVTSWTRS
ncbi:exo-beta-1,3-glucanase [Dichomitus squalens]|uniref:Exo-beta-1,3-glucanase n=1 Tax=Dichomitus squalens TaxID=114155 RepID=A0A4Q9QEM5_9APHY|nr:exo-beta-1,3-glucanase [Dichomitus squalens LYAD-421 SS1]EJF66026.1 exo-beta-1,3-glucanase [Dichomitus squalens LYAD-421 SS1]TBU45752.1 exo-beta-1,3-glucanase [Dichomitus squalens]TBU65631.1 exo-beta-1,3-glucanase [Dichomitus squalens]